jgi:hypothetical protein
MLWRVLPHSPIEKLADNLWRIEGSMPNGPLKRVMTVVRRPTGTLVVHNAIALDEPSMKDLDAWGTVREIIIPNGYHRLDAPMFRERYPEAVFYAPEGSVKRASEAAPGCKGLSTLSGDATLQTMEFAGTNRFEGALVVSSADGKTAVLNDVVFNMPHAPGFPGFILKHITASSGGPCVSRFARMMLVKDKAKLRSELESLAALPDLKRVIVSHHETITDAPSKVLRDLAAAL